jgi:hypothetical protein
VVLEDRGGIGVLVPIAISDVALDKDHHGSPKIGVDAGNKLRGHVESLATAQAEPGHEQQIGPIYGPDPKSADKETALKDRSLVAKFLN